MNNKILPLALGLMLSPLALAAPDAATGSMATDTNTNIEQQLQELQAQVSELQHSQSNTPDWTQRLHIHGFATYGLTVSDEHDSDALYNPHAASATSRYAGVGDSWDQDALSRAGLQVAADLDDNTQLVTQFLARGDDDYRVRLQWAYISHKLTPDLTVRAGRLTLPFYMHSQYHDVGYAFPWVTLPDEVYTTVPGDTADGMDITWNVSTGPVVHSLNLQWANSNIYASSSATNSVDTYHVQDMVSANLTSSWRALTVRLGYSGGKVDYTSSLGAMAGTQLLDIDHAYAYFANAGFKYDDGRFLLTGEWAQLDISGYFPLTRSSYTTAGVHFGRWLPLVTYGMVDTSNRSESFVALPAPLGGPQFVGQNQQRRVALGLRYDATSNVSLKAEVNHIYDFDNTSGLFDSAPSNDSVNLLRLSVDAMF